MKSACRCRDADTGGERLSAGQDRPARSGEMAVGEKPGKPDYACSISVSDLFGRRFDSGHLHQVTGPGRPAARGRSASAAEGCGYPVDNLVDASPEVAPREPAECGQVGREV